MQLMPRKKKKKVGGLDGILRSVSADHHVVCSPAAGRERLRPAANHLSASRWVEAATSRSFSMMGAEQAGHGASGSSSVNVLVFLQTFMWQHDAKTGSITAASCIVLS